MSGTTLTCTVAGGMAVGGAVSYSVPVTPTQTGTFSATASVTANGDSNPANNGPATSTIVAVSVAHSTPGWMRCPVLCGLAERVLLLWLSEQVARAALL